MKRTANGRYEPRLWGQGILTLDENDNLRGSSLGLGTIRALARQAQADSQ